MPLSQKPYSSPHRKLEHVGPLRRLVEILRTVYRAFYWIVRVIIWIWRRIRKPKK